MTPSGGGSGMWTGLEGSLRSFWSACRWASSGVAPWRRTEPRSGLGFFEVEGAEKSMASWRGRVGDGKRRRGVFARRRQGGLPSTATSFDNSSSYSIQQHLPQPHHRPHRHGHASPPTRRPPPFLLRLLFTNSSPRSRSPPPTDDEQREGERA